MSDDNKSGPLIGDLAGLGKALDSDVAKKVYDDGLAPSMRQLGLISEDVLKSIHLIAAPFQFASVLQDRLKAFGDRIRKKVPEEHQQQAPPEIAKPVLEAVAFTGDDSPLMDMFEELMAKAVDKRQAEKISPKFPEWIKNLSPLEALLLKDLHRGDHVEKLIMQEDRSLITDVIEFNYEPQRYGGYDHYLTIAQSLSAAGLVTTLQRRLVEGKDPIPSTTLSKGHAVYERINRLSMNGKWFAAACIRI